MVLAKILLPWTTLSCKTAGGGIAPRLKTGPRLRGRGLWGYWPTLIFQVFYSTIVHKKRTTLTRMWSPGYCPTLKIRATATRLRAAGV